MESVGSGLPLVERVARLMVDRLVYRPSHSSPAVVPHYRTFSLLLSEEWQKPMFVARAFRTRDSSDSPTRDGQRLMVFAIAHEQGDAGLPMAFAPGILFGLCYPMSDLSLESA